MTASDEQPATPTTEARLRSWRERVVSQILIAMTVVAVALMAVFARALAPVALVIGVVLVAILASFSLVRRIPYLVRVLTVVLIFSYGAVMSLASDNIGAAILYFVTGLILTTVLLDWKLALGYLGLSGLAIAVAAWALWKGVVLIPSSAELDPVTSLATTAVTYVCVGALLVLSLSFLMLRLRQTLADETAKASALAEANAKLVESQAERIRLERAAAIDQRLKSLGRLAGSVAHDFNNLLMGMSGNVELCAELSEDPEVEEMLGVTLELIERTGAMTRNLLRFSRGESIDAEQVDVHALIEASERIYDSIVAPEVRVSVSLDAEHSVIAFNPSQLEQILLNLIVNGSEAMSEGGSLSVATRNDSRAGLEILRLSVRDEGAGMSEELMARIFEPYFTTKDTGSGIGLATVRELIEGAGGEIEVDSQPGSGTVFHLSLPLAG